MRLRQEWRERFLWATRTKLLKYWHKREQEAIQEIVKYKCPKDKKPRPWAFIEGGRQLYDPVEDLVHIFLAVGIKLDHLFAAKSFVTDDMWQTILGRTRDYVHPAFSQSEINLRYSFGPHYEGQIMTYETVDIFWQFCEADLRSQGFKLNAKDSTDDKDVPISLNDFMEKYCELQGCDIPSKCELLYKQDRLGNIKLPRLARDWKSGQKKLFYAKELSTNWERYRKVMPTLPPLKAQKSDA